MPPSSRNPLFMPKKARGPPPKPAPAPATGSDSSAGPSLKALGKQRAPADRSASPAVAVSSIPSAVGQDLDGRKFEEYDIVSMGTPAAAALTHGADLGADFNVIRLYQLNSANPVPDLAHPISPIYMNRRNPNDRPISAAAMEQEKRAKREMREALGKPVQNGPNGEWRIPIVDREMHHQIDQRTGEKMWKVVQDPTLVAPEARKADKKDDPASGGRGRRRGGGGGRGRDDRGAKVYARSGNFKTGEESARNHQELNREKLPLVIEGTFANPDYQPDHPERVDTSGVPIPPTVDQKWVGKHQSVESEAWAALMFENTNGQQKVTLKLIDREYKFEPHRHINVPSTSFDAGNLLQNSMEGKNLLPRFAYHNPETRDASDDAGPSATNNSASTAAAAMDADVKPAFRNTGNGLTSGTDGNPDAFPRMLASSSGRNMVRGSATGSLKVKLEQGAYGGRDDDEGSRVKREPGGWFFGDDDDAPRRGRGIERADDEELDYNEDVADDEEVVPMGVDDEELERETKSRLQEEFFRANATAGNLQREQTPESDDEVDPHVRARKEAELRRERKLRRRLKREKKARGEAGSDDDDDDDEDDSLFGSDDDSTTEGEEDVKPVVEETKPVTPATSTVPSLNSPTRSRAASPSTARLGSARSVSPMTSAGAGHHLVASRALSPQGKRSSASSRKRKNDESQTAPPEAGRSSGSGSTGPGALQSFKKSRPNTDAGERRVTASDAEHVPVASPIDVDVDIKPGTPVPGHPTGLPKHKARGKKKRVDEPSPGAGAARTGSPAVGQTNTARQAIGSSAGGTPQPTAREASPAAVASNTAHHPSYGPLTPSEFQEAIAADYDGKITEAEFLALLKGKDKMSVKEIRDHFGKRMKKNQRGILTAKFLSSKFCNSVDGGFTLKKEFQ